MGTPVAYDSHWKKAVKRVGVYLVFFAGMTVKRTEQNQILDELVLIYILR